MVRGARPTIADRWATVNCGSRLLAVHAAGQLQQRRRRMRRPLSASAGRSPLALRDHAAGTGTISRSCSERDRARRRQPIGWLGAVFVLSERLTLCYTVLLPSLPCFTQRQPVTTERKGARGGAGDCAQPPRRPRRRTAPDSGGVRGGGGSELPTDSKRSAAC